MIHAGLKAESNAEKLHNLHQTKIRKTYVQDIIFGTAF